MIVPAHRADASLVRCLRAIGRLEPMPAQVVIVLSGSAIVMAEEVEAMGFVGVIAEGTLTAGAARNAGVIHSTGKWLAFLDSDCVPEPGFLASAGRALELVSGAVAAFGAYDAEPFGRGMVPRFRNLLHHHTHVEAGAGEASTFWTACGVVRRDIFDQLGGFRSMAMEDIDFGYRLRRAGGRIAVDPRWQVKHEKAWGFREVIRTDVWMRTVPWFRLIRKERRAGRVAGPWIRMGPGTGLGREALRLVSFLRFAAQTGGGRFAIGCVPLLLVVFACAGVGWVLSWLPPRMGGCRWSGEFSKRMDGEEREYS